MRRVIVSAPFGNYVRWPTTTRTIGTFTLRSRGGLAYRLWRVALTLRYRRGVGWVNRLGLPNPGIRSLDPLADYRDCIVSVKGFMSREWYELAKRVVELRTKYIELNLSCPNVPYGDNVDTQGALAVLLRRDRVPIAKLPPVRWMELAELMYAHGVRWFHCCNTLPVPGGGLSGTAVKQFSLAACRGIKARWPDARVIGGGGVYGEREYHEYRSAGADCVAIGSALLNPFRWRSLRSLATMYGTEFDPTKLEAEA